MSSPSSKDSGASARPEATARATGVAEAPSVCIFVHDRVYLALERLGLPAPAYAEVVHYSASVSAAVAAIIDREKVPFTLDSLEAAELSYDRRERLLRSVCTDPGTFGGRTLLRPAPLPDWSEALRAGTLQSSIYLAGVRGGAATREVVSFGDVVPIAWIPYRPSSDFLSGEHPVETIAIMSVRALVQRFTIEGALLTSLARSAEPHVELRVESAGLARSLVIDLGPYRAGTEPRRFRGNLDLFVELAAGVDGAAVATLGYPGHPPIERRTWRLVPDRVVPMSYRPPFLPLASTGEWGPLYDSAWSPTAPPLWEKALEPPASARGEAVSLWVTSPLQTFGDVTLAAEAELMWNGAGGEVASAVKPSKKEAYPRPTPLERVAANIQAEAGPITAAMALLDAVDAGLSVAEVVGHSVTSAAELIAKDALRAALDALRARTAVFDSTAPFRPPEDHYLPRLALARLDGEMRVGVVIRNIRPRKYSGAFVIAEEAMSVAMMRPAETIERLGKTIARTARTHIDSLGKATAALSIVGLGLSHVARYAAKSERAAAEADLRRLLARAGADGLTRDEQIAASCWALAIERDVAGASKAELEHFLAYVDVAATALSWTPLSVMGLALDALLVAYYLVDAAMPAPSARMVMKRLRGACWTRLLAEVMALACLVDSEAEGSALLAGVGRILRGPGFSRRPRLGRPQPGHAGPRSTASGAVARKKRTPIELACLDFDLLRYYEAA